MIFQKRFKVGDIVTINEYWPILNGLRFVVTALHHHWWHNNRVDVVSIETQSTFSFSIKYMTKVGKLTKLEYLIYGVNHSD